MKTNIIKESLGITSNLNSTYKENSELAKSILIKKGLLDDDKKDNVGMIFFPPGLNLEKTYYLKYQFSNKNGSYEIVDKGMEIAISYWRMSHLVMDIEQNPNMTEKDIFYSIRELATIVVEMLSLKSLNSKKFNKKIKTLNSFIHDLIFPKTDFYKMIQRDCELSRIFCSIFMDEEEFKKNNCVILIDHPTTYSSLQPFKDNWSEQNISKRLNIKSWDEFVEINKDGYITSEFTNITIH